MRLGAKDTDKLLCVGKVEEPLADDQIAGTRLGRSLTKLQPFLAVLSFPYHSFDLFRGDTRTREGDTRTSLQSSRWPGNVPAHL